MPLFDMYTTDYVYMLVFNAKIMVLYRSFRNLSENMSNLTNV